MRVRLSNVTFTPGGLEADIDSVTVTKPPDIPFPPPGPPPVIPPNPVPASVLPEGYDRNEAVALGMLLESMNKRGMTGVSVQGHGKEICAALNADWPGLNTYAHPQSDAVTWPGFGSLDITIDGGKGGFYFRPDHQMAYDPALFKRLNGE